MAPPAVAAARGGREDRGRDRLTLAVLTLAAGAWLLLWSWSLDGHAHHGGGGPGWGSGRVALAIGWLVMVAAMMLPLAIGLLGAVRRLVRRRARPGLLVACAGAGFLLPWALTGQVAMTADAGGRALAGWAGLTGIGAGVVTGCVLAGAGVFQLSPAKHRALAACRSPVGFAMRRWRGGRRPAADAARIGAAYGVSCVACCWALMAVMLAASAGGVLVMTPLAAVMAIERATPWGPAFGRGAGIVLIALGLALASAALGGG